MSDDIEERSADMRLLELQREAMGVPRRVLRSTRYSDPEFPGESAREREQPFVQRGAIVIASIDAQPRSGIIAGALITVSLTIANEGDAAARDLRLSLPLPDRTAYRPGSFFIDSEPAGDARAGELFAAGAELGEVGPAMRRSVLVKLLVEDGIAPVVLMPHISSAAGAILGLRALRVTRALIAHVDKPAERPFYEIDEERSAPFVPQPKNHSRIEVLQPSEQPESVAEPLRAAPAQDVPALATAVPDAVPPPARSKPKPRPKSKPKAVPGDEALRSALAPPAAVKPVQAPKPPKRPELKPAEPKAASKSTAAAVRAVETVRSVEPAGAANGVPAVERIGIPGVGGPILGVNLDRKRLSTLTGLFNGTSLGMIAHYLVLNALAVRDPLPGDNADGAIALFVARQEQLLSRALIATRLGKPPALDSLGATLPVFPSALSLHKRRRLVDAPPAGELVLVRSFQTTEIAFLRRTLENDSACAFLRAAQLFVGLCANDAVVPGDHTRRQLGVALCAYAALATAEVSRIFLRAKLSRNPEIFKDTDPSFDDAARTVLAALTRALG